MAYPKAFMETLGEYQYGYYPGGVFDMNADIKYKGKGRNNRALEHLSEKDVVIEDLVIVGRNLEKFTKGKDAVDAVQYAVESLLINVLNPELNKVKGRYDETWCKTSLVELYADWKKSQINPQHECFRFWQEHPEIQEYSKNMWATGETFAFRAPTTDGVEFVLEIKPELDNDIPTIKVSFANRVDLKSEDAADEWYNQNKNNYNLTREGKMVVVNGLTVKEAIELWLS